MCSKLIVNTAWHSSGIFVVSFDHSQHINIMFLLLTLNKYLSVGSERQVIMFWKHKKQYIFFAIKVARPISFSKLSLQWIEINYEQMTLLWTYYEHNMNIYFSSKFALGILSVLSSFRPVFWSAISLLFSRYLIFFYLHPGLDKLRARWRACTQCARKEVFACRKLLARKSIKTFLSSA